jgi:hypothetical protein
MEFMKRSIFMLMFMITVFFCGGVGRAGPVAYVVTSASGAGSGGQFGILAAMDFIPAYPSTTSGSASVKRPWPKSAPPSRLIAVKRHPSLGDACPRTFRHSDTTDSASDHLAYMSRFRPKKRSTCAYRSG